MIHILGDLIADISMRLPAFPVKSKDIHRLSYLEVGPGGACNVAIMAARFGLDIVCLGEIGDDSFGLVVREGLKREGIDVNRIVITHGAKTPVAGVVVDQASEPAYLGHSGSLQMNAFPAAWADSIEHAEILFSDGWAEHEHVPEITLAGFEHARKSGVPVFFDPGPGNPDVEGSWILEAIKLSTVILLNRSEARRITGFSDEEKLLSHLLGQGPELVILKRGDSGLMLAMGDQRVQIPGIEVIARDATGAGDSLAGAAIYAYINKFDLKKTGILANATGAAKVQKLGTGHNMPTMDEIASELSKANYEASEYLP
jgi:ribokinase